MAEMDPAQIAQSGVDPVTGSPLSAEVRKALFRRATVSGSLFGRAGALVPVNRPNPSALVAPTPSQPQTELVQIKTQVDAINNNFEQLSTSLTRIADLIQADTNAQNQRITSEQEAERKLVEQQVRIGKETELEKRIEKKLISPVEKLTPKVTSIFDRVKQALTYLFLGWLTNQTIEGLKAQSDGDYEKVNQIKINVLKNVGLAIGSIAAMKFGFGLVIRGIKGVAGRILGLIGRGILAPFQALRNIGRGGSAAASATRAASSAAPAAARGSGALGFAGKALTAAGGIMDFASGEFWDSALALGALKAPGPLKGVFAAAYGIDAIAEMFGGNLVGKNPNEPAAQSTPNATQAAPAPTATPSATPPAPTPTVQPQQTITGAPSTAPPAPSPEIQTSTPVTPAIPSQETTAPFQMNLDFSKYFSQENTQTSETRDGSKQDFSSPPLYGKIDVPLTGEEKKTDQAQVSTKVSTPAVVQAQTQPTPKTTPQVGPLPEPKPEVVAINAAQQQQVNQPPSRNIKTDVPLIKSSNPDNFWVLYSQVNYNVVM